MPRTESELTEIHNVVPTDCTVIHHDVPGPECHSIPLKGNFNHYVRNDTAIDSLNMCSWVVTFLNGLTRHTAFLGEVTASNETLNRSHRSGFQT